LSAVLRFETASVFRPLLEPARYKGAWGGRGSGKSHFFAELLIEDSVRIPGMRAACIREVQKSLKQSSKRLIEDKLQAYNLGEKAGFKVYREVIETPGDGVIIFTGMQDHTADSIKSLEGFDRAWIEEAQSLSHRSLELLTPTMRKESSEKASRGCLGLVLSGLKRSSLSSSSSRLIAASNGSRNSAAL